LIGQKLAHIEITGRVRRASTALLALAIGIAPLTAEDGTLVERRSVEISDQAILDLVGEERFESVSTRIGRLVEGITLEEITYLSDGLRVKGYLAKPKEGTALPSVIFNRGGNRGFGALSDVRAALLLGRLAARGYVVVASQYRGVAGGEGMEEFGGAEIADVLNLIPLLEGLPEADASRLGIYGWSRGGLMTYLALARSDRFKAAIVGAGVTDSVDGIERRPEMGERVYAELVPDWETNREAALEARSPIRWPETLHKQTPLLLLHGSADWRVDPTQALRMADALYKVKHPFRLVFFEGGDHGLSEYREEVDRLIGEWLDRYVRDGLPWPSLEPHGR
jgi:dipeptidyl aminopeptidase/acylaminoacyl peptidase